MVGARPSSDLYCLGGFTYRAEARLRYAGIKTVEELISLTEEDLLDIPYLGLKTLANIKEVLAGEGLSLASH